MNAESGWNAWDDEPQETEKGPPKPLVTLLDGPAIASPLPELEYIVRELALVAGGGAPHLIAGYGFSGKTLAMQAMLLSLASATPIWGVYPVRDPQRVIHVDLEQGDRLTRRRYQRLARAAGVNMASLEDRLALAVMPRIKLTPAFEKHWVELMTGRQFMLVDSLRAATGGQDENSSDIREGLDMLGYLSEKTACRASLIHHARKPSADDPGGRYVIRGSGAIYDGCDGVYLFTAGKNEPIKVEHLKARTHGELIDDLVLVIEDVPEGNDLKAGIRLTVRGGELLAEVRAAKAQGQRAAQASRDAQLVRAAIAKHAGIGTRALRGTTGLSGDRMGAAIVSLGSAIEVRVVVDGRVRTNTHYIRGHAPPETKEEDE